MKIAHVFMYDKMDTLSDRFSEKHIDKLPEYRKKYCRRYRLEADRQACIISYLLLKQGLYEKFGVTEPIEFIYNKQSKPYLMNTPHIFFNISHCRLGVVCVVSDFEIGIDIEEIHPYDPAVARLVCTDGELRKLTESPDPEHLFCRIWTGKECYAKARGISVADVLGSEPPSEAIIRREWDDYMVSLCAAKYTADQIQADFQYVYDRF